jgi:hypothetical protein
MRRKNPGKTPRKRTREKITHRPSVPGRLNILKLGGIRQWPRKNGQGKKENKEKGLPQKRKKRRNSCTRKRKTLPEKNQQREENKTPCDNTFLLHPVQAPTPMPSRSGLRPKHPSVKKRAGFQVLHTVEKETSSSSHVFNWKTNAKSVLCISSKNHRNTKERGRKMKNNSDNPQITILRIQIYLIFFGLYMFVLGIALIFVISKINQLQSENQSLTHRVEKLEKEQPRELPLCDRHPLSSLTIPPFFISPRK